MDDEPVAKRRCLSCVQKTFPDIVLQQSRPRKAFAQVQHISIHSEDTLAVKTESLFDTSAHLDCEAVTEKTFKHHVPRNKSLSGLHQATYDQDETTAHNSVRSISSAVRIHGNNGVHQANDGHRGMKGDNEVCFGMVCQLSPVQPTDFSKVYLQSMYSSRYRISLSLNPRSFPPKQL